MSRTSAPVSGTRMVNLDDPTAEPDTQATSLALAPTLRVVFCGDRPLFHEITLRDEWRIDVGRAAALGLDHDARLSRRHATFIWTGTGLRLENRSEKGSFRNGARVDTACDLVDGDLVRLGDTFLVVRFAPDQGRDVSVPGIVGRSPSIRQIRTLVDVVGPTKASVLLLGETGAGKDVVARALHQRSGRSGPLVAVNCAAIPESLAESQLFGHRAGAFTGAQKDHTGFFKEAHGGTLFLDEIGELPLSLQPKLLRVLDGREVFAVGATTGTPIDVRVIVATNRDVKADVERGALRGDLFARLAEITISLPPLRERREDVLLLLLASLPGLATGAHTLAPALVDALLQHPWPFNVRELVKVATELEVKAQGRTLLDVDLIKDRMLGPVARTPAMVVLPPPPVAASVTAPAERRDDVPAPDRAALEQLLRAHRGRITDVARATGRSRTQVYRWLEAAGLNIEDYRS